MGQTKEMADSTALKKKGIPVIITLYVSAEDLYNLKSKPSNNDQDELDAYCILSDDNKNSKGHVEKGKNLNSFTSQVYFGKKVTWVGQNIKNDDYEVHINRVTGAGTLFPNDTLEGVNGKVSGRPNKTSGEDTYKLHFSITMKGENPLSYVMDPKLGGNDD